MEEWKGMLGEKEYSVRELTTDDIKDILRIQKIVIEALEKSDFLSPLSKEEYEDSILNHLMVGVFV